jgi:universal stress protein A
MESIMDAVIRKIVVPVDFSEASQHAAVYAASLARRLDASLRFVHVLEPQALNDGRFAFFEQPSAETLDLLYWDARTRVAALADRVAEDVRVSSEVRQGSPADAIMQATIDYGADLVIMSTHGRSGWSHLLMGSVAERVIRSAHCPVLVIRECGQVHVHRPGVTGLEELATAS